MTKEEAQDLIAYTEWANNIVFDLAMTLDDEQANAESKGSFSSVRDTLAHMVGAELVWFKRWKNEAMGFPTWYEEASLAAIRVELLKLQQERREYFESLEDADMGTVVEYQNLRGDSFSNPLSELVVHVVNHSTFHRGQAINQIRAFGVKTAETDYIGFVRER
ncbi:MAG: DinB family protein [Pyrinomonadaceae bacterium]